MKVKYTMEAIYDLEFLNPDNLQKFLWDESNLFSSEGQDHLDLIAEISPTFSSFRVEEVKD